MANVEKKELKKKGEQKPGFGARVKAKYKGVRSELKKVIWPDKKRVKSNLVTVLTIILVTALIIFVFDWLVGFVLQSLGFFKVKAAPATPIQVEQTLNTESDSAAVSENQPAEQVSEPSEQAADTAESK